MPLTESRLPLNLGFQRNVGSIPWIEATTPEPKDPLLALGDAFSEFNAKLAETEKLAAQHVYHNPNFSLLDARQHRWVLHLLMYKAEELAIAFLLLNRPGETTAYVSFLDEQIERLQKVFEEWHGAPENDPEIPASFKEAMRDVATGQTADMEEDLFAADAPEKAEI